MSKTELWVTIYVCISAHLKSHWSLDVFSILWQVLHHHITMLALQLKHTPDLLSPGLSKNLREKDLTSLSVFQRQRMPFHLELSWGAKLNQLLYILSNSVGSSEEDAQCVSSESEGERDCIFLLPFFCAAQRCCSGTINASTAWTDHFYLHGDQSLQYSTHQ